MSAQVSNIKPTPFKPVHYETARALLSMITALATEKVLDLQSYELTETSGFATYEKVVLRLNDTTSVSITLTERI